MGEQKIMANLKTFIHGRSARDQVSMISKPNLNSIAKSPAYFQRQYTNRED